MSPLPKTIGRYQVLQELGRGTMGVVYLAHDPDLGREIALKVIQLPGGSTDEELLSFEERFFAEARSAARLSHPGIVIVHDVARDTASGAPFMALQFVPGKTLDRLLKERKRLERSEALRIAKGVAEALHHAHAQGVVHRDIKPANIMILPSGAPTIMDFGIAKLETGRMTATGQFVGTPLYMSPEQAMVHPVDGRSDIFSLGSVLYETLTGVPAFAGESLTKILLQLIHQEPAPASAVITSLSGSIDHVLGHCLAKDVHRRYQTAQQLADDLKDLIEDKEPRSLAAWPAVLPAFTETTPAVSPGPWSAATHPRLDYGASLETHALPRTRKPDRSIDLAVAASAVALAAVLWLVVSLAGPATPGHSAVIPPLTLLDTPTPSPTSTPSATPTPEPPLPAQVIVDFEHSLKTGVLRIFLDNEPVMKQTVGGKVIRRIIGIPIRKGRMLETLEIPAGRHTLRVQVAWDDNVKTEETQISFTPGGRLVLKVRLGSLGGLRKDLSLEWN